MRCMETSAKLDDGNGDVSGIFFIFCLTPKDMYMMVLWPMSITAPSSERKYAGNKNGMSPGTICTLRTPDFPARPIGT